MKTRARKPRGPVHQAGIVTVIFDSRDYRRDRKIPANIARELYKAGKLAIDLTNSNNMRTMYCPADDKYTWEIMQRCLPHN